MLGDRAKILSMTMRTSPTGHVPLPVLLDRPSPLGSSPGACNKTYYLTHKRTLIQYTVTTNYVHMYSYTYKSVYHSSTCQYSIIYVPM